MKLGSVEHWIRDLCESYVSELNTRQLWLNITRQAWSGISVCVPAKLASLHCVFIIRVWGSLTAHRKTTSINYYLASLSHSNNSRQNSHPSL